MFDSEPFYKPNKYNVSIFIAIQIILAVLFWIMIEWQLSGAIGILFISPLVLMTYSIGFIYGNIYTSSQVFAGLFEPIFLLMLSVGLLIIWFIIISFIIDTILKRKNKVTK